MGGHEFAGSGQELRAQFRHPPVLQSIQVTVEALMSLMSGA
jgi:hypothetical protein